MPPKAQLVGKVFKRLTVIEEAGRDERGQVLWLCRCECGSEPKIPSGNLLSGNSKSCGCLRFDTKHATTHGMSYSKAYQLWAGMVGRCQNKSNTGYRNYGAKGVKVCKRWLKFENFLADMGEPAAGMSIERKDLSKGYNPDNCVWLPMNLQGRNKNNNIILTYNGESGNLWFWSERTGLPYKTLRGRVYHGWTHERILTTPKQH